MKKIIFILCFQLLILSSIWAQFYNKGAQVTIDNTKLYCDENFTNAMGGVIAHAGEIISTGDFINEGSFDAAPGSILKLEGSQDQLLILKNDGLSKLSINTSNNALVYLGSHLFVAQEIEFLKDNCFVDLENFDLFLSFDADIINVDDNNFIITSGTGQLKKGGVGAAAFIFPIGFDKNSFTPIYIDQQGVSETIGARVLQHVRNEGSNGTVLDRKVVKALWEISESHLDDNSLILIPFWAIGDEALLFDRTKSGVSHWNGNNWSLLWDDLNEAFVTDDLFSQAGVSNHVGFFAVGNEPVSHAVTLSANAFLQGPIDQGFMRDQLRLLDNFPLVEPYSAMIGFLPVKYGGDEEMNIGQLGNFGGHTNVVDWMYIELRSETDITDVVGTKAVLVSESGVITDVEGNKNFSINGLPSGDYYVALRHRNHLGICTANTYTLSEVPTKFDFTDGSVLLHGNNATVLADGKVVMIAGDANNDHEVKYNGLHNDRNQILSRVGLVTPNKAEKGYFLEDFNLDGFVKYNGLHNDRNIILKTIGLFTPNNVVIGQLPR